MDPKYLNLVIKDLSENLSSEEKKILEQWLPGNEKLYREIKELWERSLISGEVQVNEEEGWEKLKTRIEETEQPYVPLFRRRYLQVAAAVMLLLVASLVVLNSVPHKEEIATEDHIEIFYLPDSTQVWLNKKSSLTIESFTRNERIVFLDGEAFFHVKRDSTRPFIVMTQNSRTRVLGTSFDIKAYQGDKMEEINVESGKVEYTGRKGKGMIMKLEKDQRAYLDKNTGFIDLDRKLAFSETEKKPEAEKKTSTVIKRSRPRVVSEWRNKSLNLAHKEVNLREITNPRQYLHHVFSWRNNFLKQVIVEGQIINGAIFTSYRNVKLKATYFTQDKGKIGTEYYTLYRHIRPGHHISYKFRLSNWFKQAEKVLVEIEEAHAIQ